ncbi:hypothetical protein D9B38_05510 [Corynebacterium diphtheriae]|uniref:hypothetical protein n=2 Tax=Corynebacterium diphtheriae TaxID=1717 RepID=UPI00096845AD|nr:hypothetical protein [Corynebacterium diphtheriae]MBG9303638.1 hypothetical protein [Corynebacterium diphtheriae bv. mitis]MBG9337332.1 hypothetical protein [Corynebacterium diphtheriae bv. mitis]OLN17481.1 hypothetical protein BUE68_07535 [Corynebacterium diphtheriae]RKW91724.1 hypothetical protein D9B38_05510 [Corynebacterium diphtheriae]CAB0722460.1 hypothetical protein FRC0086_00688 [Corynebacterium diphtheriae]
MGMNIFIDAVAAELERQPWYLRYKATILMILTGIAWGAGAIIPALTAAPAWVGVTVATVVNIATVLTNRLTKDGVTPSMGKRLEKAAEKIEVAASPASLPVYTGPSTGGA